MISCVWENGHLSQTEILLLCISYNIKKRILSISMKGKIYEVDNSAKRNCSYIQHFAEHLMGEGFSLSTLQRGIILFLAFFRLCG